MENRFDRSIILEGQGIKPGRGRPLLAELQRSRRRGDPGDLHRGTPRPDMSSMVVDACQPSPRLIVGSAEADIVVVTLPALPTWLSGPARRRHQARDGERCRRLEILIKSRLPDSVTSLKQSMTGSTGGESNACAAS